MAIILAYLPVILTTVPDNLHTTPIPDDPAPSFQPGP
jgi:hypothetical protein